MRSENDLKFSTTTAHIGHCSSNGLALTSINKTLLGQQPQQGTNSYRMGRFFVCPFVPPLAGQPGLRPSQPGLMPASQTPGPASQASGHSIELHPLSGPLPCFPLWKQRKNSIQTQVEQGKGTADHLMPLGDWFWSQWGVPWKIQLWYIFF